MDKIYYAISSKNPRWKFLDGYACASQSINHFLRHLGCKYYKFCNMIDLNNAYETGAFTVSTSKVDTSKPIYPLTGGLISDEEYIKVKPDIVNRYWGQYGYILEFDGYGPVVEKMCFLNEEEAESWIKSHI